MDIAHFVHRYPPALGGAEAYTRRLSEYLAGKGDRVTVWTTTAVELGDLWTGQLHSMVPRIQDGNPSVRRYQPMGWPGRRYLLKGLSLIPNRRWQCLTTPCNPIVPGMWRDAGRYIGPVDAVHALAFPYSFPAVCGLRLARMRKVPFLLTPFLHLGDPTNPTDRTRRQYTAPHLRWLLNQADRVFVQTEVERRAVLGLGVADDRVIRTGMGVDPADCAGGDRASARANWAVAPNEVVVGHLANASVEKGTVDLLRAAAFLWSAGLQFRVVLAGPEMPNFRRFWDRYPMKTRVTRLGVLSESEKRDFFAGIDCFALPSRSDSFGLVLLEAWANGKPNVVYRAGGPAELVRDGVDGLQADCGNVEALAERLGGLVGDQCLRERVGECGQVRVLEEMRWPDRLAVVRQEIERVVQEEGR